MTVIMQSTVTTKDKKTNIVEEIALIVKLVCPKEKKKKVPFTVFQKYVWYSRDVKYG